MGLSLHHTFDDMYVLPIIYKVLAPSKRWLFPGFLNHQPLYVSTTINHLHMLGWEGHGWDTRTPGEAGKQESSDTS